MSVLETSILKTIKDVIGVEDESIDGYKTFDSVLITHINSAFSVLKQLGVSDEHYFITGYDETWGDFFEDKQTLYLVKTYIGFKVQLMFDPPESSHVLKSCESIIQEMEWRMNFEVETSIL